MVEIRWVTDGEQMQLQQRTRNFTVDASGAFCGVGDWSEWEAVEVVHSENQLVLNRDSFPSW